MSTTWEIAAKNTGRNEWISEIAYCTNKYAFFFNANGEATESFTDVLMESSDKFLWKKPLNRRSWWLEKNHAGQVCCRHSRRVGRAEAFLVDSMPPAQWGGKDGLLHFFLSFFLSFFFFLPTSPWKKAKLTMKTCHCSCTLFTSTRTSEYSIHCVFKSRNVYV